MNGRTSGFRRIHGFRQLFKVSSIFGIHRLGATERRFLWKVVGGGILRHPWIFAGEVARHFTTRTFTLLDVFAWPERIEFAGIRIEPKFLALDERFREINRVFHNTDVGEQISSPDVMLDQSRLVTGRNVFAPFPTLFDVGCRDGQHIAFPDPRRETHPGVRRVFRGMSTSVHPDRAALFVSTYGFVNRNQLMRDGFAFLPDPHLERSAMDVFHYMDLTLVLRKREPPRTVSQSPLPRLIINR